MSSILAKLQYFLFLLIFCSLPAQGHAIPPRVTLPDSVQEIYQFPKGTWIENLAVRSNGQLLLTLLNVPELYLLDPIAKTPPVLIHRFPEATSLAGITETAPDIFAVIAGNFTLSTGKSTPGSYSIWTVDLTSICTESADALDAPPKVTKVAAIPEAQFLNGMTLLSSEHDLILVGDIVAGNVYSVSLTTGAYSVVLSTPFTAPAVSPSFGPVGINGLHVREDGASRQLYFTNTGQGIFARIPIRDDGTPAGETEVIAHTLAATDYFDDFAVDRRGVAYLVTGSGNALEKVSREGKRQRVIAGGLNETTMVEPTAVAFGRGVSDKRILYVTTAGGLAAPLNGNEVIGAQVVAVDTEA